MEGIASLIGLVLLCAIPAALVGIFTYLAMKLIIKMASFLSGVDRKPAEEREFERMRKRLVRQASRRR